MLTSCLGVFCRYFYKTPDLLVFLTEGFVLADVPPSHLAKRTNTDSALHGDPHCQVQHLPMHLLLIRAR